MADTVQPPPIEDWSGVDAARFREEIVPRNRPAMLRGAAEHWPLVERAHRSPQELVDYLIGLDNGELVTTSIAPPEVGGLLVYKDGLKEIRRRAQAVTEPLERRCYGRKTKRCVSRGLRNRSSPSIHSPAISPVWGMKPG